MYLVVTYFLTYLPMYESYFFALGNALGHGLYQLWVHLLQVFILVKPMALPVEGFTLHLSNGLSY
jgi:hypothetical protein